MSERPVQTAENTVVFPFSSQAGLASFAGISIAGAPHAPVNDSH